MSTIFSKIRERSEGGRRSRDRVQAKRVFGFVVAPEDEQLVAQMQAIADQRHSDVEAELRLAVSNYVALNQDQLNQP